LCAKIGSEQTSRVDKPGMTYSVQKEELLTLSQNGELSQCRDCPTMSAVATILVLYNSKTVTIQDLIAFSREDVLEIKPFDVTGQNQASSLQVSGARGGISQKDIRRARFELATLSEYRFEL
jgi:hypothetical protein